MKERFKIFTHYSGEGSTVSDSDLEDAINEWLAATNGKLVHITQSECRRGEKGQHITVCVWYRPGEAASS